MDRNDIGREHHHGDGHEILLHVEGQLLHEARLRRERADVGDQERVAVSWRLRDEVGADVAGGAWLVLDDDRLAD